MAAAIDRKDGLLDKLAAFGGCVESSSVYIVLAIDSTIDALQEVDQIARALALSCESILHEISMNPALAGCLLDPAEKIVAGLSAGQQRIDDLLPGLIVQRLAAAKLDAPDQGQRDLVNFAFERCIESSAWVLDALKKLREAIATHDLTSESRSDGEAGADAAVLDPLQSDAA